MSKLKVLCSALFLTTALVALALPGCSGECTRAGDCASDEVCYQEICQKSQSPTFAMTCSTDEDCDVNGDGASTLYCELGRCRLRGGGGIVIPDAGPMDGGPVDSGDAGADAGMPDSGDAGP